MTLEFAINKTDIVGLVSKAWKLSFARVNNNQKAVASRGWGPRALAYNALLHPEILTSKYGATTTEGQKVSTDVDPEQLNSICLKKAELFGDSLCMEKSLSSDAKQRIVARSVG